MRRALLRRATETYSQLYGARSATKLERMQRRSNATVFVKRSTKIGWEACAFITSILHAD